MTSSIAEYHSGSESRKAYQSDRTWGMVCIYCKTINTHWFSPVTMVETACKEGAKDS